MQLSILRKSYLISPKDAGPGPGLYFNSEVGAIRSDTGYTIPRSDYQPKIGTQYQIGPGYYHKDSGKITLTQEIGKGGISIPRQGRNEGYDGTNSVGPGAYNISRDIIGKERGTFGKQKRVLNGEDAVADPDLTRLGPGAYTVEDETFKKDNGRGISIVGKPRPQSAVAGTRLGPGQYYRDHGILNNEAYSFGKGVRKGLSYVEGNRIGPG